MWCGHLPRIIFNLYLKLLHVPFIDVSSHERHASRKAHMKYIQNKTWTMNHIYLMILEMSWDLHIVDQELDYSRSG